MIWGLVLVLLAQTGSEEAYQAQLQALQDSLREVRAKLNALAERETAALEKLTLLKREELALRRILDLRERQRKALQAQTDSLKNRIGSTEAHLRRIEAKVAEAAALLYRTRGMQLSLDPAPLFRRQRARRLLLRLIDAAREVMDSARALQEALIAQRAAYLEQVARLEEVIARQKERQRELATTRRIQERLLRQIRSRKGAYQKVAARIRRDIQALEELLARLEEKKRRKVPPPTPPPKVTLRKGTLPWPVQGKVVVGFGTVTHPVYKTRVRNNGVDILAREGAVVQAVAPGEVVYSGFFMGYGNMVIVDHGGFMSIYANLGRIYVAKGARVERGTPLGDVGRGVYDDRPVLHFELRVQGRPVNPLKYLS